MSNQNGTIYLTKFCDTNGKCIYKIGKTINVANRFRSYHYSDMLFLSKSTDLDNDERELIKIFTKSFKLDKGKEFFESDDENRVKSTFMSYFMNKTIENPKNIVEYSTLDTQYTQYKNALLGTVKPQRFDQFSEYYYLSGEDAKRFVNKIKSYGCNLKIDQSHIANMKENLISDKTPHLFGNLAIIEYTNYKSNSIENLIELIDGHHRIECLKQIYRQIPTYNIGIWIALHKSDSPTGPKTRDIFRKYNLLKPFIVDVGIAEVSSNLIDAINQKMTLNGFTPIKDSDHVIRPAIKKSQFNTILQQQLELFCKQKKIHYKDIDISNITDKIYKFNVSISTNSIDWFQTSSEMKSSKPITDCIYANCKRYSFFLCLLDLQKVLAYILQ